MPVNVIAPYDRDVEGERAADDAHPADGAGNGGAARLCRAGAAHRLVIMGTDVDQPRNLAKSVTVE